MIFLLPSCLEDKATDDTALMGFSRDSVVFPGDRGQMSALCDSVLVEANRSWTAKVMYVSPSGTDQDWLEISKSENCVFSGASERSVVILSSLDNVSDLERSARVVFYCQDIGGPRYVEVSQRGLVYRINSSPSVVSDLDYKGDSSSFNVDSNIPWHIEVVSGDRDDISFHPTNGVGRETVGFEVSENPDTEVRQWEIAVVPDTGYESSNTSTVSVVQAAAQPYLQLDAQSSDTVLSGDEKVADVCFRTNANWTAELKNASSGISLDKTSGTKADRSVSVIFGENTTPNVKRKATVVLSAGNDICSIDILQHGYLTLYFSDGTSYISQSEWPFSSPTYIGTGAEHVNTVTPFVHRNGYSYIVKMTNGLKRNSKGLYFMGTTNDYIEFPSFPECRIVSVSLIESGAGKKRKITDTSGNVVPGGEAQTAVAGTPQTWTLVDSKNGTPYRFTFHSANMNAIIREISVYYE